jgi:hypothetical protein
MIIVWFYDTLFALKSPWDNVTTYAPPINSQPVNKLRAAYRRRT